MVWAGPVAFVGSWALAGATTAGYSAVENAISDLAAVDATTRVAMTTGSLVDGLGLIGFGLALRETREDRAWIAAVVTGACTLGVAATSLGGWSGDQVHAGFAGLGYVAIAAVLAGTISAASLVASTFGPARGLWQRLGLTVASVDRGHRVKSRRRGRFRAVRPADMT